MAAGGLCHFIVNRCSFALAEMTNASVLPGGADSETICTKNLQQTLLLFCGLLLVEKGGDKTKHEDTLICKIYYSVKDFNQD